MIRYRKLLIVIKPHPLNNDLCTYTSVYFRLSFLQRFRSSTNLLQKLPPEVSQVSVIVSLYSDEKGYSIMLPVSSPFTGNYIHLFIHSFILYVIIAEDVKEIFMPYEVSVSCLV